MLLCNGIEYAGTGFLGDIMLSIGFVAVNIPLGGQKDLSNKEYSYIKETKYIIKITTALFIPVARQVRSFLRI